VRILVSNDDGIHAPGLEALTDIARALSDDVWVVAPETEQSGASHSLTLNNLLRIRQLEERKFAVQGTPSDCVILGVKHVLGGEMPDLVLSGVNRGQNMAEDVTYSGTIAAAMEGTLLGIPSIAMSQVYDYEGDGPIRWDVSRRFAPDIIRRLVARGWPADVLININFPPLPVASVKGARVVVQGRRHMGALKVETRQDPRGNDYFWIGFRRMVREREGDTDLKAVRDGYIAITPLHLDLTHVSTIDHLRQALDSGGAA
jgi:5'-nucleotidase